MQSLEIEIGKLLSLHHLTLSVAESCSAGGVSSKICSVSGSSNYFLGGIVAYSNQSKIRDLGVSQQSIQNFTEVSKEVAIQMSEGISEKFNSDFSVSTTGYAGPLGKDIGKVFISVKTPKSTDVKELKLYGNRGEITDQIIYHSLQILLDKIKLFISEDI
jgi:PncC family amidohydrolase